MIILTNQNNLLNTEEFLYATTLSDYTIRYYFKNGNSITERYHNKEELEKNVAWIYNQIRGIK